MSLKLYNTRTRTVEPFAPLIERRVRIYVCGLTPSAEAHLGHARSFLFFDVLRRYLVHAGYDVTYVQNVTDIDDRSIARARETGERWDEVVERHFQSFKSSMRRLGVQEPDVEPRATHYVPQIVEMIAQLIATGHAYATEDGVYYAVKSFPRYGALSNRNVDELLVGARIAIDEHKADALDFALWKFAKPGEPAWESPWGAGRPGWHIECSAMSRAILGEPFDIHGGGFDLIFPHHENEIAQSEVLMPAPPMANVWMHGGLLMFDGKKMSKSLGNFEPLSGVLDRHDPLAIRILFLQTGYRKPMNFTEDAIAAAMLRLERLQRAWSTLKASEGAEPDPAAGADFLMEFEAALDEDMNTSVALAVLDRFASSTAGFAPGAESSGAYRAFDAMAKVLGLDLATVRAAPRAEGFTNGALVVERLKAALGEAVELNGEPPEAAIEVVIAARNEARRNRDFALADKLRNALAAERVILKDNKDGTTTWTAGA